MDDLDDVSLLFFDHRTAVCGFASKSDDPPDSRRSVRHQESATDPLPASADRSTSTNSHADVGSQTTANSGIDWLAAEGVLPKLAAAEETRLADWLRRIAPAVERELLDGPTPLPACLMQSAERTESTFQATAHQVISSNRTQVNGVESATEHACAAWLSVVTQDAPMLAVAVSLSHSAWCDHSGAATVEIFQPQRKDSSSRGIGVFYAPFGQQLMVPSCVQSLSANPYNRDMLAAGAFSGDVCAWEMQRTSSASNSYRRFVPVACKQSAQFGSVVAMAWLQPTRTNDAAASLLCAHVDGLVVLWRFVAAVASSSADVAAAAEDGSGMQMVRDKIYSIRSSRDPKETARLSALAARPRNGAQFHVGTEDGTVYDCSLLSAVAIRNSTYYDPIVSELHKVGAGGHRFAVSSIRVIDDGVGGASLITVDVSGEVLIHSGTSAAVRRLRMPECQLRRNVFVTQRITAGAGRWLLSAGADGALEIVSTAGNGGDGCSEDQPLAVRSFGGQCSGARGCGGRVAVLSDNECWAVTGMYKDRMFQLFRVVSSSSSSSM